MLLLCQQTLTSTFDSQHLPDSKQPLCHTKVKIQGQVWIAPLLLWVSVKPLTLLACIYCDLVNRTENTAHGSDLNSVISTWQGGGIYLYSSHIPYKFFKQIKSCGGWEGGKGKKPIQNWNFPRFPTLVWRAGSPPHTHTHAHTHDGVSPLTQLIRNSSRTANTEVAHCLHFRKNLATYK